MAQRRVQNITPTSKLDICLKTLVCILAVYLEFLEKSTQWPSLEIFSRAFRMLFFKS